MIYDDVLRDSNRAIDVGIVTIVPIEVEALFDAFSINRDGYELAGSPLQYWRTSYQSSSSGRALSVVVSIVGGEAGNVEAAIATTEFLRDWYPRLMCLVGIAAGLEGKTRVGDVVMPNKVHDRSIKVYENGRFAVRGRTYSRNDTLDRMLKVSPLIHEQFLARLSRTAQEDMKLARTTAKAKGLVPGGFDGKPRIIDGSIASDNVLIRDSTYFQDVLTTTDEKCRGGEMEAAGFVLACQKERMDFPWLVVRGIADFGDNRKDDSFQLLAAKSACAALRLFIESSLAIDVLPANPRATRASTTLDASLVGELRSAFAARRWKEVCRIGAAISRTLWLSGHIALRYEIGSMVENAAAYSHNDSLRARTLIDDLGWTATTLGKNELGWKHIEDGIRLANQCGDHYVLAKGHRHLASLSRQRGDLESTARYLEKAQEATVAIADEEERIEMSSSLQLSEAKLLIARGRYSEAIPLLVSAQEAFRQGGDIEREVKVYGQLAYCQEKLGNAYEAERHYLAGRVAARDAGRFDEFVNTTRSLLALLAKSQPERCEILIREVHEFAVSHGLWDEARIWQKELESFGV